MRPRALVALLLAAGCGGDLTVGDDDPESADAPPGGPVPGEPAGLEGITAAHNQARAAKGIAPLTWDADLAAIAQAWAERCVDEQAPIGLIDHNPGRSDTYPGYVGENIYGSGGPARGTDAVALWIAEEADYDYPTNTCRSVCGHYTQVVWADTSRLGCGIHSCPGLTYGNTVICNYAPGGNLGGQRPY
jgi:pathogenesis-related protein 1